MVIAITGGRGFIGKLIAEKHLNNGDQVRILTRQTIEGGEDSQFEYFHGSLNDIEVLEKFVDGVDILYHCAAEIRDERVMNTVNNIGTENLVRASSGRIKHWVHLSSVGVYGPISDGIVSEWMPYNPMNEYERTKTLGDQTVITAGSEGKFTYAIIRPSIVYGPEMRNGSLFSLINAIEKGLFFFIGEKGASANYVAVENVVNALFLAGNDPKAAGKIYNISDWTTMETFISIISRALGKPEPKIYVPLLIAELLGKAGDYLKKIPLNTGRVRALSSKAIYNSDLISSELGFKITASHEIELTKLVKYYKESKG